MNLVLYRTDDRTTAPIGQKAERALFGVYRETEKRFSRLFPAEWDKIKALFTETLPGRIGVDSIRDSIRMNTDALVQGFNTSIAPQKDYICFRRPDKSDFAPELATVIEYAHYRRKNLLLFDTYDQIISLVEQRDVESIFIITYYNHLDIQYYLTHYNRFLSVLTGFLPYEDLFNLNFFLLKLLAFHFIDSTCREFYHKRSILINRVSRRQDSPIHRNIPSDEFSYFPKPFSTLATASEYLFEKESPFEFNYLSHCRECTLFFSDFFLCGYRDQPSPPKVPEQPHSFKPLCSYDRTRCTIKERKRISASALKARFLFLNGCNLGDLNRSFIPYRFSLVAYSIDASALSVITSPGIKSGHIAENILAYNLFKSGLSEGQRVERLNSFLTYSHIEKSCYFLIGDPCIQARDAYKNDQYTIKQTYDENNTLCVTVEIKDREHTTYITADIEKKKKPLFIENMVFVKRGKTVRAIDKIYYQIEIDGSIEKQRLDIFSADYFPCDTLFVTLRSEDTVRSHLRILEKYHDNLQFYSHYFVIDSALKGKITDLLNNLRSLYPLIRSYRFDVWALLKTRELMAKTKRKFEELYKRLFLSLVSYTAKNMNNYYEEINESRVGIYSDRGPCRCIYCGNEQTCYTYELYTFQQTFRRLGTKCLVCGSVSDIPDQKITVKMVTRRIFSKGGKEEHHLFITNHHDRKIRVHIAPLSLDTEKIDIDNLLAETDMKRGETYDFRFRLTPLEGLEKHYYLFAFYVMADTSFYFFSQMFGFV